jgi:hypothetical protein
MGGESQRGSLNRIMGCSVKAQCIGKPAYLEPNRDSMQKTIEDRSAIGAETAQKHDEKNIRGTSLQNYLNFLYIRGYRQKIAQQFSALRL